MERQEWRGGRKDKKLAKIQRVGGEKFAVDNGFDGVFSLKYCLLVKDEPLNDDGDEDQQK